MDAKNLHGFQNGLGSSLLIFLPLKTSFLVQGGLAAACWTLDEHPGVGSPPVCSAVLFPGPPVLVAGTGHYVFSTPVSDETLPDHI